MELVLEIQQAIGCLHCMRMTTPEDSVHGLCAYCQSVAGMRECTSCGEEFMPGFLGATDEVDMCPLCDDCAIICEQCETRTEDTITVKDWNAQTDRYENREVCQGCIDSSYTRCDNCRDTVDVESTTTVNGDTICNSCIENYSTCDRCNEYTHVDNLTWDENGDNQYCESCHSSVQAEENSMLVHSYSYSPSVTFFDAHGIPQYPPAGFFHGIELECGWKSGSRDEYAEQVTDALGEVCYLKEDSTITGGTGLCGGFEIVTHPCDLAWYRNNLSAICDSSIPGLISHNTDNGGCGLHISVNRNALTNHAIARICAFIGADQNEDWIVKLARRKSDQWAEIVKKTCIEDTLETVDGYEYLKTNSRRYEAVNLQNSSHVEFRLFRGTLKYSSAMLCLEFVNALCHWCMEPTEVSEYQSAHSLLKFANSEPATYPHLITFLCANL